MSKQHALAAYLFDDIMDILDPSIGLKYNGSHSSFGNASVVTAAVRLSASHCSCLLPVRKVARSSRKFGALLQ